jgi:hypothetical protein
MPLGFSLGWDGLLIANSTFFASYQYRYPMPSLKSTLEMRGRERLKKDPRRLKSVLDAWGKKS